VSPDAVPSDAVPPDAVPSDAVPAHGGVPVRTPVVVCSLETWTEVRRRIRILVDELIDLDPSIEILFVAPAVDVLHQLRQGDLSPLTGRGTPPRTRLEEIHPRLHVLRPRKWWPRVLGPFADRALERQVLAAVDQLGFRRPLLWINDASYAGLAAHTGWPTLYDITDDWLLTPLAPRQRGRLMANEESLMETSGAVVVCSPDLARTRGSVRPVELIPNGVDVDLFRSARPRPVDLPAAPVALYVGTLHTWRIDVPLILDLARSRPDVHVVLVGPNDLPGEITDQLEAVPTIRILGARPYDQVPAYLQHADIVIIPHLVSPFTESLDPIKAYECLAAGRPTVATPVAGFRELGPPVVTADRSTFVGAAWAALDGAGPTGVPPAPSATPIPTWHDRALALASVMAHVRKTGG
jgi:glycosyltransferase involved in cell wall biosynthesis